MITDQLKEAMIKSTLTQEEIAQKIGVSAAMISLFLNGHRNMNSDKIDKLCKLFKLELYDPSTR